MNDRLDLEFIKRAEIFCAHKVKENEEERLNKKAKYYYSNFQMYRQSQKKYWLSDKGRKCYRRKRLKLLEKEKPYLKIFRNLGKNEIKQFYLNCPKGYEVDHIIPRSKGGPHHIGNLQYLTRKENRRKSDKWIGIYDGDSYDPYYLLKNKFKHLQIKKNYGSHFVNKLF